ncbi:hypothetical protein ES703_48711 [subsurface metagenome]
MSMRIKERFYGVFFLRQYAKAKVASPTKLKIANVIVTPLPQSVTNSFTRRPIVPMINRVKAVNLATSLI